MFTCFAEGSKDSDSEGTDRQLPLSGPDLKAMEKNLKPVLKANFRKLVNEDDAEGLEEALEAERIANPKPLGKKNKKKAGAANGSKEEDEFAILGRRLLHYASALDAVDCCKLLLTTQNFPRSWVDAVDEVDQRSALHVASLNHSKRCMEVLLKQGANVALKNKNLAVPLEEALLSAKVHVDWDFVTPAAQIVEKIRDKDLTALRTLEQKCKDLLIPVAFKLAKSLKLVPLVALLIVARSSFVVNSVAKKIEGEEESAGTLVDLLLGKALTYSSVCSLDKVPSIGRKTYSDGAGDAWSGEISRLLRKNSCEGDAIGLGRKTPAEWESPFETKYRRDSSDWDDNSSEIKYRKDMSEWEEINSKYRSNGCDGESSSSDSKFKRSCSGNDPDRKAGAVKSIEDKCAAAGEDIETNCKIARKLLECILLFSPRLSAHPQSPALPPLLRAAQNNDEVILSLLLEAGAPINETDSDGNTALHWALRQATPVNKRSVNSKLLKRLLDAGANVLMGNKLGATPVHTSAGHGHYEALKLILEKEAGGVNVMAATKETPLHYSVKNNHILCTALLLTHGANRNVSSLRSQKPFQLAPSHEMRALLSLDDATVRELPPDTLLQTLAVLAQQQQATFLQGPDGSSMTLSPTFAQAASQMIPGSQMKSQFQFPQAGGSYSGALPLSFSQSLSMPALSESSCHSQLAYKSCLQYPSPLSSRSHSLPSNQESRSAWNAVCSADSFSKLGLQRTTVQKLRSSDVESLDDDGKPNVNLPAWKTVLCRNFGTSEGCTWGSKCHFAHSEEELRAGQQNLKATGEKFDGSLSLKGFQLGQFVSDAGDQVKNFKTKLCMHHEKMGSCPHGGKCKFAHGDGELRPLSATSSLTSCTRIGMPPSTASSLGSSGSEENCNYKLEGEDQSSKKVFVGGLPHFIHSDELWEFFESEFGKVHDAVVICGNDEEGKPRSRGFGFVLFEYQKDADEAVKRHYFPFRGKKVEVKRAMARMDSPSGDEAGKLASSFSSGISSPAAPLSPAMPSSLPSINLFNDGMQLPNLPPIGPPPGWSIPSLSPVEGFHEGVHTSSHLFSHSKPMPVTASSAAFLSEHNYTLPGKSGIPPQSNSKLSSQGSGRYSETDEPFQRSVVLSNQNGIQPLSRNTRPLHGETNLGTGLKPYAESSSSSYSVYPSSSVNSSLPSALSIPPNGTTLSRNGHSDEYFSYFGKSAPEPYPSSTQSKPDHASDSNGEEDEELSQLVQMLKGPSPPSQPTSLAHTLTYSSQPPVSTLNSQTGYDGGVHHGFLAQNGAKDSASMYRDPPHMSYNGVSSLMPSYSGLSTPQLPDGFREVLPSSSSKYKEAGQGLNNGGYQIPLQVGNVGYNPHLPVGSKTTGSENHASNSLEPPAAAGPRGGAGPAGTTPHSSVMSLLLPGYNNSQQGTDLYDYGHYGAYDGYEVSR